MTNPLQTALRDAYHETYGNPASAEFARLMAEALARRGVGVEGEIDFPYQRTFNAIADAVKIQGPDISISVDAFQKSFNKSPTAPETAPAPPRSDVEAVAPVLTQEHIDHARNCMEQWHAWQERAKKAETLMKKFTGALELRLQTYDELHAENDLSAEGEHGFLAFQVFARDLGFTILPAVPAQPLRVTIGAEP